MSGGFYRWILTTQPHFNVSSGKILLRITHSYFMTPEILKMPRSCKHTVCYILIDPGSSTENKTPPSGIKIYSGSSSVLTPLVTRWWKIHDSMRQPSLYAILFFKLAPTSNRRFEAYINDGELERIQIRNGSSLERLRK